MTLLSWSKQYEIGNDLIDNEHEELFRLINNFHSHWLEAHDRQTITRLLNQLVAYAEMHFRDEELTMQSVAYPGLEQHQQAHEAMVEMIFKLQQSYEDGSLRLEMDTMKFIKAWLLEHILEVDYLFRDFLAHRKNVPESNATAIEP